MTPVATAIRYFGGWGAQRVGRAVGTFLGLLLILSLVMAIFRLPVVESLLLIAEGAFGDAYGWSRTAVKMTPLLLTGLGMVVAWRAGMYNIGGEGQFVVGALLGGVLGKSLLQYSLPIPAFLLPLSILAASVGGGAAWAWLAGWLYVRRGVEVVISTILLNFVAIQLLSRAVTGPIQESKNQVPLSDQLPARLMLPKFSPQMEVHAGVFIALVAAVVIYGYLFMTRAGYQLRLVGDSERAARANRVEGGRVKIQAMLVSGGLCGLAGGVEYVGLSGQLGSGFAQGWGFLGIPVALLGGLNPLWSVPSAFFFGVLFAGSENLSRFTQAGTTLVYVIQAAVVLGVVCLRAFSDRRSMKLEAD